MTDHSEPELLTPVEAAAAFRVTVRTLNRWEHRGSLTPVRLPSGHRRYRRAEVQAILATVTTEAAK